ncbi:Bud-site selection protein [Corynascus similis CBS 632.67]
MPKRKRDDISLDALIPRLRTDIFHALKQAKGFERQRQSKRLSDPKTAPEKKARIENEIVVLKSLDLQQTAHAHLCTSLLKVKAVADSADRLPAEVRAGVPKPDLTEEERAALHNVTSSLYNRVEVRRAVEKAIEAVCRSIGVPVPDKKGKGKKEKEGKAGEKVDGTKTDGRVGKKEKKKADQAEEREGHEARDQEPGKSEKKKGQKKTDTSEQPAGSDADEEEEEKAISQLDKMLGLESDEESPGEEEELLVKGRVRKPSSKELDPMEITTDEDASEDEDLDPMEVTSDEEGDSDSEDEFDGFSDDVEGQQSSASDDEDASDASSSASSVSRSPPPKKVKGKGALKPTDSTFLPSLMGGYISGSESASDIDIAPQRKNRRGQRARQALWEKKYGEKAKHLQQGAKGRDSGWDAKRGAVDGDSKPWKRGIRNPLLDKSKGSGANETQLGPEKKKPAPRKRDDTGPLHPSWEAKRKAKEKQQLSAPFQGKKITFD